MRRALVDIVAVLSLLVAVVAAGVWVRSGSLMDLVRVRREDWDVQHNTVPEAMTYVTSARGRVAWSTRGEAPAAEHYLQRDFELHWQAGPVPPLPPGARQWAPEGLWLGWVVLGAMVVPAGRLGERAWRAGRGAHGWRGWRAWRRGRGGKFAGAAGGVGGEGASTQDREARREASQPAIEDEERGRGERARTESAPRHAPPERGARSVSETRSAYGRRAAWIVARIAWTAALLGTVVAVFWVRSYPYFERADWKLWSDRAGMQVNSSRGSIMLAWTNKGPDRMIKRRDFAFVRTCEPPTRGPLDQAADLVGPSVQMAGFTLGTDRSTAWAYNVLIVPYWFAELVLLATAVWAWRYVRRQSRRAAGRLCARCGYDLRATPERCPECGLEVGIGAPLLSGCSTVVEGR